MIEAKTTESGFVLMRMDKESAQLVMEILKDPLRGVFRQNSPAGRVRLELVRELKKVTDETNCSRNAVE